MNGKKVQLQHNKRRNDRGVIAKYLNYYNALAFIGFIITVIYIISATEDVVYSDYIRLILSYIKDVTDFTPYMGLDIFTRMPVSYLQRIVNVKFFGYSTTFDMMLGALGLFFSSLVLAGYAKKMKIGFFRYFLIVAVHYSLNKWEMLTNGSGWIHFMAFALFFWHYECIETEYRQEGSASNHIKLIVIPIFTILFVAGPYSGTYALSVLLAYACIGIARAGRKPDFRKELFVQMRIWIGRAMAVVIPLCMYIFSRIHSVEDHAGATDRAFSEVFSENPMLFVNFFLKTFASMLMGKEFANEMRIAAWILHLLGFGVLLGYACAFYVNVRCGIWKKTILPMVLLVSGVFNHIIITLSRWIFLKDPLYAMSSRYALQFQVGIIGILLTSALLQQSRKTADFRQKSMKKVRNFAKVSEWAEGEPGFARVFLVAIFLAVAVSQLGFYVTEWRIARYRKAFFVERKEVAVHFERMSDEEIKTYMQYRSVEKTKEALLILRSQKLNIFRE